MNGLQLKVNEFRKIGLQNEYWLWNFYPKNFSKLVDLQPYSKEPHGITNSHVFKDLVDKLEIPVFETYTEDALDFLLTLDNNISKKIYDKSGPHAVIIGFNKCRLVSSTMHPEMCYCVEGLLEIIGKMNPELLLKLNFD